MANELKLPVMLYGVHQAIRYSAWRHASFRDHLRKRNCTVQIRLKDNSQGRVYRFEDGRVRSWSGTEERADAAIVFKDRETALGFLKLPADHAEIIHAAKNFRVEVEGPDDLVSWFMQLLNMIPRA
ncbi:MAG: pyrogallol hydroxytransferase large subunit, partial [Betaproteobacteria bacterium]|nr:pyrogallol hydroxytransferase large subunit [Betaproteobacteria bacterium]